MRKSLVWRGISLALGLACLTPSSSFAQSRAAIYTIGNVSITVPIPEGYVELNEAVGNKNRLDVLRALTFKAMNTPTQRTIGVFLLKEDIDTFLRSEELVKNRVFYVQTNPTFENKVISAEEFQQAAAFIRKQPKEISDLLNTEKENLQNSFNDSVRQNYPNTGISMTLDAPIFLGIFHDEPRSFGVAILLTGTTIANSIKKPTQAVQATVSTLVKGKMVGLRISSDFQSKVDLDWVKAKAVEWNREFSKVN